MKHVLIALALTAATAYAAETRTVAPGAAGPNRLDVDVPLLAGAAPGFADVRLIDQGGRELGYLLIEPRSREPQWVAAALLDVKPTKTTSGFEADLGAIRPVDRLHIGGVRAPFLKHVTLEGSGDRAHWTLLADTTVFDLPDQKLRRPDIAFTAGEYRYLRVTWDDRTSARVSGVTIAEARLHDAGAPPDPLRASMSFQKLSSEPSRSRYRVLLPAPHLPIDAIEVQVGDGDVFREASVTEPQLTNGAIVPVPLGTAQLRRAVRDGFVAAEMAVPIHAPAGRELQLVIDDGANAPLPVSAIVARFAPQPWLYFESPDGAPLTVRYGDPRAKAPRYDLEAARPYVGKTGVALARWTSAPAQTAQPQTAAPPPLPALGSAVDPKEFRYARPLPPATGLVILPLDADVLAHGRDLADVRIVDRTNHQVPYVVERRDEPLKLTIGVPPREETEHGTSRYRVHLPYDTLPAATRLVVRTPARVFDRSVRLVRVADERRGREEAGLAEAEWKNVDPDTPAAPLTFDSCLCAANVDLIVSEGDNAPLPISSIELLLPSYALRFEHPGGALKLLYGNPTASTPQYDLALLAPRILTEPAKEIAIGKAMRETPSTAPNEMKYFWIAIAVAAIILLGLLARLLAPALREETSTLGETPRPGDSSR